MLKLLVFSLITLLVLTVFSVGETKAAVAECRSAGITYETDPPQIPNDPPSYKINFHNVKDGYFQLQRIGQAFGDTTYVGQSSGGNVTIEVTATRLRLAGEHTINLQWSDKNNGSFSDYCQVKIKVGHIPSDCKLAYNPPNPRDNEQFIVAVENAPPGTFAVLVQDNAIIQWGVPTHLGNITVGSDGKASATFGPITSLGDFTINLKATGINALFNGSFFCSTPLKISASAGQPPRTPVDPGVSTATSGGLLGAPVTTCSSSAGATNPCLRGDAESCDPKNGGPGEGGIKTAIGCVPNEPKSLVETSLRVVSFAGGGVAFLLMVFGAFTMVTSAGNPEAIKKGQDQFRAAIIGLLFILFSVVLLQIIGVDILSLPGFVGRP